jgi:hypothetical protein
MNYRQASVKELVEALCKQERHPDLELIRVLLDRGEELVPDLIEIVEGQGDWPQTHAALLLCELRAEGALPVLQRAFSAPEGDNLVDWLSDDALEKFGPAALDTLETIAADKTVGWYPRAVAGEVMRTIAFRHRKTYGRVTAALRGLLPDPDLDWSAYENYEAIQEAVGDPQVWTSAVARLCELRDPEAYDLIGRLFEAGLVDEMVVDPGTYREMYRDTGPPAGFTRKPLDLLSYYRRSQPRKISKVQGTRRKRKRRKRR